MNVLILFVSASFLVPAMQVRLSMFSVTFNKTVLHVRVEMSCRYLVDV